MGVGVALTVGQIQSDHNRTAFDRAYRAQALGAPFMPSSQSWEADGQVGGHGDWKYVYRANVSGPAAVAQLQAQLGHGGYQVKQSRPDVIGAQTATLYRDLITGGVSLQVDVAPDSAQPGASYAAGPVEVVVRVGQLN
ncbi:MAG TPA: hypothetical protein VLI05_01765 [Candidatus Saccharimonadia bacterium]|nr:hypothetical protein [Candidatus Saccharimonadia bacterium]